MIWIYLAAALFGGAFLIPMLIGGLDLDTELEVEADLDMDLEAGGPDLGADAVEAGADAVSTDAAGEGVGALADVFSGLLSFRSAVFFSAFFGLAGIVFDSLGYSTAVTLITSILLGLVAALANSALFGLIRRSQSTSQVSNRELEGRPANVVLPLGDGRKGRIRIDLSGQPQFMVALPYQPGMQEKYDVGDTVVVVEIENGTALVAPLRLDLGEED